MLTYNSSILPVSLVEKRRKNRIYCAALHAKKLILIILRVISDFNYVARAKVKANSLITITRITHL